MCVVCANISNVLGKTASLSNLQLETRFQERGAAAESSEGTAKYKGWEGPCVLNLGRDVSLCASFLCKLI